MEEDALDRIEKLERRVYEIERRLEGGTEPALSPPKSTSIREFLISKNPRSDVEKTLVIACYLETLGNVNPFNLNDLRSGFSQAKEPLPSNLSDAVNKNIQKGFIMEAPERKEGFKAWVLTNTGVKRVHAPTEQGGQYV